MVVSELAGHVRIRASGAYLGQSAVMRSKALNRPPEAESGSEDST